MKYTTSCSSDAGICRMEENHILFVAEKTCEEAFFKMEFHFPDWEEDCYVMMPACAYNGNRFQRVARS